MTNDDNIRDDKVQYNTNREAANISALFSSKTDKFKYLTGEEILPSAKMKKIKQAKFTFRIKIEGFQHTGIKDLIPEWNQDSN